MEYVLILVMLLGGQAQLAMQEFGSKAACENAGKTVAPNAGQHGQHFYYCVPKG